MLAQEEQLFLMGLILKIKKIMGLVIISQILNPLEVVEAWVQVEEEDLVEGLEMVEAADEVEVAEEDGGN